MDIIFILVEPAVPENIGAAARAIKTMGFNQLRLVNTKSHLADEARWLAHGSTDVLNTAQVYNSLEEAIADLDFTMGTTAKNRSVKFDYYSPEASIELIEQKKSILNKVGIVFGREESGLTNKELQLCDMATTIPIKTTYPSLNLAQSVMLMAYVFSQNNQLLQTPQNNTSEYSLLKWKTTNLLKQIDIKEGDNLFGRIMERLAAVSASDTNLFLSFISRLEKRLLK